MITQASFREQLPTLGFQERSKGVFTAHFQDDLSIILQADFNNKKLIYPETIDTGDNTTCNFEHPENFVVFECVCRQLEKGYRPEHIVLEKRWKLGHEEKSGKADICVYDQNGQSMLLIIECKTYGQEYSKERKQTLQDGGQLFSYWQQERSTKWLALYASDFKDGQIIHECEVIPSVDDANVVELAKKDDSYRLYKNAYSNIDLFEVWDETYGKAFLPDVIFSDDSVAYQIGVRPLRKCDLKDFKAEDKIVNRFEEILRHNNVSDKENAFNRLTALFICKLVDEINHAEDNDELEFQYKQGTDTYESLQDRLQKLHTQGMKDFMRETIFYIANDYPDKLLEQYAKQKRQAMIEDQRKTIRILKFYSNNDFSFKDVHNEELFLQNGKVLVEVVQQFERYRIVYNSKEQFLGDLFEQLLNKGFKQNEGQFFTPMPITRFIWDSQPLEKIIHNSGKYNLPKVIDYACGAGHFLTEAVEAINDYLEHSGQQELRKENAWVEKSIFGIEKDYRLARVSKISLFMNGAGYGNIIFGDGLDNYPDKGIAAGTFDILVANPPYSVAAFKQHFKPKNNSFELSDKISNAGDDIEVLFVERIAQLLKPKGQAAVILPSPILTNATPGSYIGARENLLENFMIHAIVEFDKKTFGATGTHTVVLFLEKYDEPPKRKEMVKDSADAIQSNAELADWEDQDILTAYLAKIEVSAEDYRSFYAKDQWIDNWRSHAYFGQFVRSFEELPETKKKKAQKSFRQLPEELQKSSLQKDFYDYVLKCEQEKLRFFALVYKQTTLVVTAPVDNDAQKEFLGYDWSNRKGAEGIQIQTPGGKLYCNTDRYAPDNTAAVIRTAFTTPVQPPADLEKYCVWHNLQDMIDFSRVEFNKEIKPSTAKKIVVKSKWPIVFLDSHIAAIEKGQSITKAETKAGQVKVVAGGIDFAYTTDKPNRPAGVITVSASGANAGFVNYWDEEIFASDCSTILGTEGCLTRYLYFYLCSIQPQLFELAHGSAQPHVYPADLNTVRLPLPPLDIQQKIVAECAVIDTSCDEAKNTISACKNSITAAYDDLFQEKHVKYVALKDLASFNASRSEIGDQKDDLEVSFIDMPSVSNDGYIEVFQTRRLVDVRKGGYTYFRENEIIIAKITPCMENGKCAIARGLTNGIGFGSTEFHTIRCSKKLLPDYLFHFLNRETIRQEAAKQMTGASGHRRVPISYYEKLSIPLVPLHEQQQIVDQIEKEIAIIRECENTIDNAHKSKYEILARYL